MIEPQTGTAKNRVNTDVRDYITYRGQAGMFAWLLHRLTGIGVLLFVFAHVIDTALIGWGPGAYNKAIQLYRMTGFRIGEILLVGAVLYHALNGIRITIMDFWPQTTLVQKRLYTAVVAVFLALYLPSVFIMVKWLLK
jgi:succinate dehydrogenase / fumarate reductase, cytochrome b subunit